MATFDEKLQHSIDILRKAEKTALRLYPKGFYLAFSGGKDSQSLYHVAVLAGVKFEAHYSLSTLDPPPTCKVYKSAIPGCDNRPPCFNLCAAMYQKTKFADNDKTLLLRRIKRDTRSRNYNPNRCKTRGELQKEQAARSRNYT